MRYEFLVDGEVSPTALAAFPELQATPRAGWTSMYGPVADDSDVMALLVRFGDLGLRVVEMRMLPD